MSDKDDHVVQGEIPVSAGVPSSARYMMAGAALIIFLQGAFVVSSAAYGRVWPATNSVQMPLK